MTEWINDMIYKCESCGIVFKVYTKDDEPRTNFCPTCGSRKLRDIEEEDE